MSSSLDLIGNSQPGEDGDQPQHNRQDRSEFEESSELIATTLGTRPEDDEEDDETEVLTTKELVQRMQTAWINEKFAPCLLEPQTQIVDCLLDQISQVERNLTHASKSDFRVPMHKMEISRIRYLIASYLRIRLQKIQKFIHTLSLESDLLSKEEVMFARNYKKTLTSHFKTLALDHMPGDFGQVPTAKKVQPKLPEPYLNTAVFIRVEKDCNGVLLEDETLQDNDVELDLKSGSQHILRYKAVMDLIRDGSVKLI